MTAYVGFIIDDFNDSVPIAAGEDHDEVFTKTFARIAPEIRVFNVPRMAVQEKDITVNEAAELESICHDHFEKVYGKDPAE